MYGKGRGLSGQSYGLITKNLRSGYTEKNSNKFITYHKSGSRSVSRDAIIENIIELYEIADKMSDYNFLIAYSLDSNNLCGYSSEEIAEMFKDAGNTFMENIPNNIMFEKKFDDRIFNLN